MSMGWKDFSVATAVFTKFMATRVASKSVTGNGIKKHYLLKRFSKYMYQSVLFTKQIFNFNLPKTLVESVSWNRKMVFSKKEPFQLMLPRKGHHPFGDATELSASKRKLKSHLIIHNY